MPVSTSLPSVQRPSSSSSSAASSTTLRQTFDRIDGNRDNALSRAEVKRSMEQAGVGAGFFGSAKVDGATDALVGGLDGDKNGRVSWDEYVKGDSVNCEITRSPAPLAPAATRAAATSWRPPG